MDFSRQEYWSGLPFPSPEDLPSPGIEPCSPTLRADCLPAEPPGKPKTHDGSAVKNLPAVQEMQEMWVWSLGWGDPREVERQSTPVFLPEKNPMDRGAWWATVHGDTAEGLSASTGVNPWQGCRELSEESGAHHLKDFQIFLLSLLASLHICSSYSLGLCFILPFSLQMGFIYVPICMVGIWLALKLPSFISYSFSQRQTHCLWVDISNFWEREADWSSVGQLFIPGPNDWGQSRRERWFKYGCRLPVLWMGRQFWGKIGGQKSKW